MKAFIKSMRGNLIETMQDLLRLAEASDVDISDDISESSRLVSRTNAFKCDFNSKLWDALDELWDDPGRRTVFERKDETVIPDHMDYLFAKLNDLRDEDYVPTEEDILRARIRSIGIDSVTFNLELVIFCVSFADFDKPMFEDPTDIFADSLDRKQVPLVH
jgi:uncharacterized protein (UPF0305 family)